MFITNLDYNEVVEYAHGGEKPILVLHDPNPVPAGCAVDLATGDLAVSSLGSGTGGGVAIYKGARGTPRTYTDPVFKEYFLCAYDDKGNLFVDGQDNYGAFKFAELPEGRKTFTNITLNQGIGFPGGVQWDGKHVAVGDQNFPVIYQFAIKGSSGDEEGKTSLGSGAGDVFQFFVLGSRVIVPNQCKASCTGNVLYYEYPAGGTATKTIMKDVRYPHGAVVSKANT